MSLVYIREFIKERFKALDKNYHEHDDAFNIDNIGENKLDKAYHIFYANLSNISIEQTTYKDEINVVLSIFSKTTRDSKKELDKAFDFANKIRMSLINPKNLNNQEYIRLVKFINMEATPLQSNDNAFAIKLNFRFMIISGYNQDLSCDC